LAIGPFEDVLRVPPPDDLRRVADVVLRRELVELPLFEVVRFDEPDRLELERPVVDEPFRLVDLFVLEPPLDELLLEDSCLRHCVFASLFDLPGFRASCAFRAGGPLSTTRCGVF